MMNTNRWNAILKKATAWALAGVVAFSCAACSPEGTESPESHSDRQGMGRYVETALNQPDTPYNQAVTEQDGNLLILGSNGVSQSTDGGKTWEKVDFGSPALKAAKEDNSVACGKWDKDGRLVFATLEPVEGTQKSAYQYHLIDKDGTQRELPIKLPEDRAAEEDGDGNLPPDGEESADGEEDTAIFDGAFSTEITVDSDDAANYFQSPANGPKQMEFSSDGSLLILDDNGSIHQIDLDTGEIKHTLKLDGQWIHSFTVIGNTLALNLYDDVRLYDLNTWEGKEPDPVLNQFLTGRTAEGEENLLNLNSENRNVAYIGNSGFLLFNGGEDDTIYICGLNGVYRHLLGGTSIEQLIVGSLTSLGDPSCQVNQMIPLEGNSFLALCASIGNDSLLRYDFDPNVDATPKNELNAYMFNESTAVRQAIAGYQKAHPDVMINLEVALGFSGAMTASDCLRVLNANIMAGKGPDLLFMDDMPIETYLNKGILADLSDTVKESAKEGELLENVVSAYARDGKICAVPTRLTVPMLTAPKDLLSKLNSLDDIAQAVEDLRKQHPYPEQNSITGLVWSYGINEALAPAAATSWYKADGSLDQEKIREYLQTVKKVFDAENLGRDENDTTMLFSSASFDTLVGLDLYAGNALVSLEDIQCIEGYITLLSVLDSMEGYGFEPIPNKNGKVFVPNTVVGVNAKSQHMDVAKDFVKYLLSEEHQSTTALNAGIPVNTAVYEQQTKSIEEISHYLVGEDGRELTLCTRAITEEELANLTATLAGLDTPVLIDKTVYDTVTNTAVDYADGISDLDSSMKSITDTLDLYLAES